MTGRIVVQVNTVTIYGEIKRRITTEVTSNNAAIAAADVVAMATTTTTMSCPPARCVLISVRQIGELSLR